MKLTKDAFFKKAKGRIRKVENADIDGLYVRELTAAEHLQYYKLVNAAKDSADEKAQLDVIAFAVVLAACDVDGKRLFTADDAEAVKEIPFDTLNGILKTVFQNAGTDVDAEAAKKN